MNFLLKTSLVFILLVGFTACTSKARYQNMVINDIGKRAYTAELESSIDVLNASGGQEINSIENSDISNEDFSKALVATLVKDGLYKEKGKYRLKVEIIELDNPMYVLDMTATIKVKYTLLDLEKNIILLDKTIVEAYTATVADEFFGVNRHKLATEGAARKNINSLLDELSALNFNKEIVFNLME